jgi:hypothetical protein
LLSFAGAATASCLVVHNQKISDLTPTLYCIGCKALFSFFCTSLIDNYQVINLKKDLLCNHLFAGIDKLADEIRLSQNDCKHDSQFFKNILAGRQVAFFDQSEAGGKKKRELQHEIKKLRALLSSQTAQTEQEQESVLSSRSNSFSSTEDNYVGSLRRHARVFTTNKNRVIHKNILKNNPDNFSI